MPSTDTLETLRLIMEDVFDLEDLEIDASTTADDVEGWNSLGHIRLVVAVERKFKIEFKNSEIEAMKDVGDLVKTIDAKTA